MTRRHVTDRSLLASGVFLPTSLSAFVALCVTQGAPMADTLVHRAQGAAVRNGTDLHGFTVTEWRLPATYPPFAALLFVPTTWLPLPALKAAFVLGNTALLALLVHLSASMVGAGPLPAPTMLTALTAFLATVALGTLTLPAASVDFWTRRLHETERVGKTWIVDNHSLRGLPARTLGDPSPMA